MSSLEEYQLIIIGGGLSGLAAGIRFARFGRKVLILEQHTLPGGLNSYYFRQGFLLETGLHAMTNFAPATDRRAPLSRLFRQLKLSRRNFQTHEQFHSEIVFQNHSLHFSNDFSLLQEEISREFPGSVDNFNQLIQIIKDYNPFKSTFWRSTRELLSAVLAKPVLEDMLLLPLMVYGNSEEHDMDFSQFVIMFRSIFGEGFFRPAGTIRDFLNMLLVQYQEYGGEIRYRAKVSSLFIEGGKVRGVVLENGEELRCSQVLSTVGIPGTAKLSGWQLEREKYSGKMSFMETISILPVAQRDNLKADATIIFYNTSDTLTYACPALPVDVSWGVICYPENFQGLPEAEYFQVRVTNSANYDLWQQADSDQYQALKNQWIDKSVSVTGKIIGNYTENIVYRDCFTPITIERFTAKAAGAVYGSPLKIKDGRTPWPNLFIAGTDQGYLGIVGSMLSGVSIVNQHLLP